ncbi:DNA replication initiation factor cdc45, variant 2 [Bonamia ostreae]|uniref:DNA replication initiation factor cdc45, variant 2 n=1 Tax=Bonamia ostreae TaxID=126728 RepID=A0ABV2AK47_9EUKA
MQHVRFSVIPVTGYQNLKDQFDHIFSDNSLKNALFLNNGGSVDLASFLLSPEETDVENDVKFYVFDSHRPFDLANVSDENERVSIFCDNDDIETNYPPDLDAEELNEDELKQLEKRLKRYYNGTFCGQSSALCAFKITRKLSKNNNNLIWAAIVGVTDQLVHEKIRAGQYFDAVRELNIEVLQLNVPGMLGNNATNSKTRSKLVSGHVEFSREFLFWRIFNFYFSI